ncbi:MAG: TolC family protein [Bacteroidetes bacterium]|nr:TolC family protein [Bacteroidota bacterium]
MINSNKLRPTVFSLLILFIGLSDAIGQSSETMDMQSYDFEIVLPPLSVLIDSAIHYNPMVKFREHEINAKVSNMQSQKYYWIRNLGVQADMRYGTYDIFTSNVTDGQNPYMYATRSNQLNYGVGAFIKFPFYDFVNRKNQIKQAAAELSQATSRQMPSVVS